jgi:hypothetical protein
VEERRCAKISHRAATCHTPPGCDVPDCQGGNHPPFYEWTHDYEFAGKKSDECKENVDQKKKRELEAIGVAVSDEEPKTVDVELIYDESRCKRRKRKPERDEESEEAERREVNFDNTSSLTLEDQMQQDMNQVRNNEFAKLSNADLTAETKGDKLALNRTRNSDSLCSMNASDHSPRRFLANDKFAMEPGLSGSEILKTLEEGWLRHPEQNQRSSLALHHIDDDPEVKADVLCTCVHMHAWQQRCDHERIAMGALRPPQVV